MPTLKRANDHQSILISGIQKCTLIDFPERTACIVFLPGCNFRCGYCYNPEFVLPQHIKKIQKSFIGEEVLFNFLEKRKGLLDGVVISGGEPTIHAGLPKFIEKIKNRGFQVKLDTNGNNPEMMKMLIEAGLLDYIAMDFKTSLGAYPGVVGQLARPPLIQKSLELIKSCGLNYEFRTTLIKEIHSEEILRQMAKELSGAKQYFLQTFKSGQTLDPNFESYHAFSHAELEEIAKNIFAPHVSKVQVR